MRTATVRVRQRQDRLLRWFSSSKVVGTDNEPLVLYHGTTKKRFRPYLRFGMGPHFAEWETAAERIYQAAEDYGRPSVGRMIGAYLRIENPIRMRDVHFDQFGDLIEGLIEAGVFSERQADAMFGPRDQRFFLSSYRKYNAPLMEMTVDVLRDTGFDGIAYRNFIEGGGEYTWIPFGLDQIMRV